MSDDLEAYERLLATLEQRVSDIEAQLEKVPGQLRSAYREGHFDGVYGSDGETTFKCSNTKKTIEDYENGNNKSNAGSVPTL